jgi:hypothetical protein
MDEQRMKPSDILVSKLSETQVQPVYVKIT